MTVQVPMFEKSGSKPSKQAAQLDDLVAGGFDVTNFVENFDVLTEAVGGLPSLRRLVLTLAVTGRLTRQVPSDGNAETLLAKLRSRIGTDGKQGSPSLADPSAGPSSLPTSWCWATFLDVASIDSHLVDPSGFRDLPHVAPDNIEKGTGRLLEYRTIGEDGVTSSKHRFFAGQLVYSKIRPNLSKVVAVDFDGLCSADMYPLTAKIDRAFLHRFMLSQVFLDQVIKEDNRLAMPKVNQEQLGMTLVAVPPLPEQKRIVAKVDELMKLIDDLEAKQTNKREVQTRFRTSALDALTKAEGPEATACAWKRVAGNFERLFGRVESVSDLRQAALWAAMHGSLTRTGPQARETLLDNIRSSRRRVWENLRLAELKASGSVPKGDAWKAKYQPGVEADRSSSLVAGLPKHWEIASLEEVAQVIDPNPSHRYPTYRNGTIPLLSTREFRGRDTWDASGSNVPLVPSDVHGEQDARCRFSPRDIIMARKGRLGLARFSPPMPAYVFSHTLFVIKVCDEMDAAFVLWFLRLDPVVAWLLREMNDNTGVPTLGKGTTERMPVPVPPLPEQKRIVAKVDQLMKLCDDLEAQLKAKEGTASKLVEAVVKELVGG